MPALFDLLWAVACSSGGLILMAPVEAAWRLIWFDLHSMYFKKFKPMLNIWEILPIETQILQREDLAALRSFFAGLVPYRTGIPVDLGRKVMWVCF